MRHNRGVWYAVAGLALFAAASLLRVGEALAGCNVPAGKEVEISTSATIVCVEGTFEVSVANVTGALGDTLNLKTAGTGTVSPSSPAAIPITVGGSSPVLVTFTADTAGEVTITIDEGIAGQCSVTITVIKVDLEAHRTCGKFGEVVADSDEDSGDPNKLVVLVNDDWEENPGGGAKDNEDSQMKTSYPPGDDPDDDLVEIALKQLMPAISTGSLHVELSDSASVRVFKDDGTGDELGDLSVDLASPSGDLAGLASGDVTVWLEGLTNDTDFVFSYVYKDSGGAEICRDDIHMRVVPFRLRDQTGALIDDVANVPKDLLIEWGVENDSTIPMPDMSIFYMEIDDLPPTQVSSATVFSETVATDFYVEDLDPGVSIVRSKYFGTIYTSAPPDLVTGPAPSVLGSDHDK